MSGASRNGPFEYKKTIKNFCKQGSICHCCSVSDKFLPAHSIKQCFTGKNTPFVKFKRNHIRDSSSVFSISSLVRISMLSLISSLSHKLYLNSLVYDRNIFGSSSKVFGNLRKIFGNVRATFGQILENLRKFSENRQFNAVISMSI